MRFDLFWKLWRRPVWRKQDGGVEEVIRKR